MNRRLGWLPLALVLAGLASCGDSPEPAAVAADAAADADTDPFGICRMLAADEVARVLPGHDGGSVGHSGASLIDGVSTHHCNYTASHDADIDLLTVIVTVADSDELFEEIRPTGFAHDDEDAVAVGDGGWRSDDNPDQFGVTATRKRAVLKLELMATGAQQHAAAMIELAQAVAAKL